MIRDLATPLDNMLCAGWPAYAYHNQWISDGQARMLLVKVWDAERVCPEVDVPKLIQWRTHDETFAPLAGYYDPDTHRMSIRSAYRCRRLLLHEIAHAEGHHGHDPAFMRRYATLLVRYARISYEELFTIQGLMGLKLREMI